MPIQNINIDTRALNCGHSIMQGFELGLKLIAPPSVKRIIFNNPATIVFWEDGTKTVVKVSGDDVLDREKGVLLAYMKKVHGSGYYRQLTRQIEAATPEVHA